MCPISLRSPLRVNVARRSYRPIQAASVVLTRHVGSNGKARETLLQHNVEPIELPLVEFRARPEAQYLTELLRKRRFDWVTLTSPHATSVFIEAWRGAGGPSARVASFASSLDVLSHEGSSLLVGCVPSTANSQTLVQELPRRQDRCEEVLYPASSKADDVLERGLRERHFIVTRLDTYDTATIDVETIDALAVEEALQADVVTFASPSAVRAWIDVTQKKCHFNQAVACIGSTTAKKARQLGFTNVYYAEKPGHEGLIQSILGILRDKGTLSIHA